MRNRLYGFSHFIFDFDETLATLIIDWTDWHDGVKKIVKKHNPHFSHEGKLTPRDINSLYERYGKDLRRDLLVFNEQFESAHVRGIKQHPQVLATLKRMKNKNVHLLTSNSRKTVLPFLEELEILHLFTKIITRDDVQRIKPDPHPFSLIKIDTVPHSEYVMIGDSEADSGFAHGAGISFVHVDEL